MARVRQLELLPAFPPRDAPGSLHLPSFGDKTEPPGQDAGDRNFEKRICLFFSNCEIKT